MYEFYFEKLKVWKGARELSISLYHITKSFPKQETYAMTDQIRRAAVSVACNLAEGSARSSRKDQMRFTNMAYSSLMEVLNLLLIASDLGYIPDEDLLVFREKINVISKQLNALRREQLKATSKEE